MRITIRHGGSIALFFSSLLSICGGINFQFRPQIDTGGKTEDEKFDDEQEARNAKARKKAAEPTAGPAWYWKDGQRCRADFSNPELETCIVNVEKEEEK